MSSSSFDAGDIIVLDFPFSDLQQSKIRPGLVITSKKYNAASPDIIVLKITSSQRQQEYGVVLNQPDLDQGALKKQIVVRTDYPLVIEKSLIRSKIAEKVKPAFLAQIKKKLGQLYGI